MAVIAGNWKMHMGPAETQAFFEGLTVDDSMASHELLLFPPSVSLTTAAGCAERDPRVQLGAQNIHWEERGAYTGEISAAMARQAGATYALIGHSERRHVFGETDDQVALKVGAALRHGLVPVICVGETLDEREEDRVDEVILGQLDAALAVLHGADRYLIAYEPVWATGTGRTATPADAAAAHASLRARLESTTGLAAATRTAILYGGSVKPANAQELFAASDVDGVLVGGASLDAESFASIVRAAG